MADLSDLRYAIALVASSTGCLLRNGRPDFSEASERIYLKYLAEVPGDVVRSAGQLLAARHRYRNIPTLGDFLTACLEVHPGIPDASAAWAELSNALREYPRIYDNVDTTLPEARYRRARRVALEEWESQWTQPLRDMVDFLGGWRQVAREHRQIERRFFSQWETLCLPHLIPSMKGINYVSEFANPTQPRLTQGSENPGTHGGDHPPEQDHQTGGGPSQSPGQSGDRRQS